jgi:hypothetical protein
MVRRGRLARRGRGEVINVCASLRGALAANIRVPAAAGRLNEENASL